MDFKEIFFVFSLCFVLAQVISTTKSAGWWWRRRRVPNVRTDQRYKPSIRVTQKGAEVKPNSIPEKQTETDIGINFNDARKIFEDHVREVYGDNVKAGKVTITNTEGRTLSDLDVDKIYEVAARNRLGEEVFDSLPSHVQTKVVNALYSGDLEPQIVKLIKERKWNEVGEEKLDHSPYPNDEKLGSKNELE